VAMAKTATYPSDRLTVEDVWAMPNDGRRHELVDGVLIVTPAPAPLHQLAVFRMARLLDDAAPEDVRVLPAPLDYKISEHTMLEPDVIVARKSDYGPLRIEKTPLLVVEVLSPSTARYDAGTKRLAYEAARVPWYWVVDPDEPSLTVLELVEGAYVERDRVVGDGTHEGTTPFGVRVVPADLVRS
jgi:Uma2 family endonuclease